jgi:hypothetical protein
LALLDDFDYRLFRLADLKTGHMADVTGEQGMLIPPRHLIPSMVWVFAAFPTEFMRPVTVRSIRHFINGILVVLNISFLLIGMLKRTDHIYGVITHCKHLLFLGYICNKYNNDFHT